VLRALADTIWRAHYPGIITVEQIDYMLSLMYAPEVVRREIADGVMWELALLKSEPAGFLSCAFEPAVRQLKLSKLYLLPSLQGRGFGRQMLGSVKAKAATLGAAEVYLTVNKNNAKAIAAYQRAGFRITDSIVSDIGGGFVMDDYVMTFDVAASQ
jgi:ribosomal protein S18 acetylase RimI-like enzyme